MLAYSFRPFLRSNRLSIKQNTYDFPFLGRAGRQILIVRDIFLPKFASSGAGAGGAISSAATDDK